MDSGFRPLAAPTARHCVGAADLHGYFRIAAGLAEWNGEQGGPDLF